MVRTAAHRRRHTRTALLIGLAVVAVVVDAPDPPGLAAAEPAATADANLGAAEPDTSDTNRYIVEVDAPVADVVAEQESLGVEVIHEWDDASAGFAAALTPSELDRLAQDPAVTDIHLDQVIEVSVAQSGAPWGLDRIDQRNLPLDGTYDYDSNATRVTAYVVDTGIRSTHVEFTGRVGSGAFIDFGDGRGIEDCNSHGTHVAGTLGGTTSGVAKAVTIVPVKVFDCSGAAFISDVIIGLNWIVADHQPGEPAVVNMSLGTDIGSAPLDSAVNAVIADGITVVAAAGNSAIPSCSVSPARVPDAITAAATNSNDSRASYSNTGSCNDLFAPGSGIVSAGITSDTALATKSGTSMAAPHVAGAVARYLQQQPGATPAQVRAAIDAATDPGVTARVVGDPDKLLFVAPPPPPCTPPPAGIIGWWTGDGTTTAVVGPTLTGTATHAPGVVGDGFAFGTSGPLTAPGFPTASGGVSVEAWVRPTSDTRVQTIAARWDFPSTDDSARSFVLRLQPGSRIVFETDETSTRRPEVLSATAPQLHDGQAHHVAATWDRTRFALYVDGVQIATKPSQGGTLNPAATTAVTIGGEVRGLVADGIIDEPTIYSRTLTAAEIAAIHVAGAGGKCV